MSYRHKGRFISKAKAMELGLVVSNPIPLIELIATVTPKEEAATLRKLEAALDSRAAFEAAKNPFGNNVALKRCEQFLRGNKRFARFLAALNVDPDLLLNKQRQFNRRSDLKGVMKLKLLHSFIIGETKQFNRTDLALFALTIIAANKGLGWISNPELELVLNNTDPASLPEEVRKAVSSFKHKFIGVADARAEACRFRTTYDNLGCYFFSNEDQEDANRNGVLVQMDSPIIQHLCGAWGL